MDKFEALWAYQAEDMKAEAIANAIKGSPTRQKLEKARDFILDRQKMYQQIEDEVVSMADRKDIISQAVEHSQAQLAALKQQFELNPPQSSEAIKAMLTEVGRCRDTIRQYEVELNRIVKESANQEKLQRSVRMEAAKAKQSFDALKAEYDEESKSRKAELDEQRARAKELEGSVDPGLLSEYLAIRKHVTPPVSRLTHNQCSGCNTGLPSAVASRIKAGAYVECETCGRMIIP